jgi:tRNA (guanine37-N1)-methyltransferase
MTGAHLLPKTLASGPTIRLITLFPDFCELALSTSIVGRARRRGLLNVEAVDPRRFAGGRHRKVDDRPFGGGPGMVLMAPPLAGAIDHCQQRLPHARLLLTSPQGRTLDQAMARELATSDAIVLCGHYEGFDQRLLDHYQPEPFSIGPYVLSGGELPALVLVDAIARMVPGVLGDPQSAAEDTFSFAEDEVDHPSFTRPLEWRGRLVPEPLKSGDHAAIGAWRAEQRQLRSSAT